MKEFLWKYLVGPIVADAKGLEILTWNGVRAHTGYNLYNTAFYVLTALVLVYLIKLILEKRDIDFTSRTALHSIPFMLLGGTLRFLEDAGAVPYPYNVALITPLIYLLVATLYLPLLYRLDDRQLLKSGILITIPALLLALAQFKTFNAIYVVATILLSSLMVYGYVKIVREEYGSRGLVAVAATQFFAGAASMNSTFYGYDPKQLLAQNFNRVLGFPGVLVMKLLVVALSVKIVSDIEEEQTRAIALTALYAVGLGTGFRVFLRVAAGL